ncbi:hypothetical protein HUJ05_011377, partial [Dendroctonus ponderosae]
PPERDHADGGRSRTTALIGRASHFGPIRTSAHSIFRAVRFAGGIQLAAHCCRLRIRLVSVYDLDVVPKLEQLLLDFVVRKTVTIVEAIYQLKRLTKQKMLVCAPANAACNMLTEKLAKFCRPNELRRIMSESCDTTSVHKDILKYCNLVEIEKQRDVIRVGIAELKEFRIVVTTLILAAKYTKEYHPDIIFVDEAAQAREPELCCAMGLLIKTKRLVLAGDPKQLGPTHRCWNA